MRYMQKFFQSFFPFLIIGVGVVLALMGIFLFSYLLIGGAIVAVILYVAAWVRARFGSGYTSSTSHSPGRGRIIDGEYTQKSTEGRGRKDKR